MKMKGSALLATAILLAAAMTATIEPRSRVAVQSTSVSVPFEIVNRHVLVRVTVNQSRPLSFVLDTGATPTIIKLDVARELDLKLEGVVNAGGAGAGGATGSFVRNATWTLPEMPKSRQTLPMALPLARLAPGLGQDADGIIGGDFIRQFVVELDFHQRRMILHNKSGFRYSGRGEALPIEFDANAQPVLRAEVTPIDGPAFEGRFLFDLGADLALALHSPAVRQRQLPGPNVPVMPPTGGGAGGEVTGKVGRVGEVKIGSFRLVRPITLFSEDRFGSFANPALTGNIGFQIASRFKLFLDYEHRRIIFEPTPSLGDPFDRAFSGVGVRAYGSDYRTFRVAIVREGTPGAEAGLRVDDVITAIDGTSAADLTLEKVIETFERSTTCEVTIQRGTEVLKLSLTAKKLG